MRLDHRMRGTEIASEHGTFKGMVEGGFRHPAQHTSMDGFGSLIEAVAWFCVGLVFFAGLMVVTGLWAWFCWTSFGWFWGLVMSMPAAFCALVMYCSLAPIGQKMRNAFIAGLRGKRL